MGQPRPFFRSFQATFYTIGCHIVINHGLFFVLFKEQFTVKAVSFQLTITIILTWANPVQFFVLFKQNFIVKSCCSLSSLIRPKVATIVVSNYYSQNMGKPRPLFRPFQRAFYSKRRHIVIDNYYGQIRVSFQLIFVAFKQHFTLKAVHFSFDCHRRS